MPTPASLLLFVHLAAAIVWVGGMVFAHFVLRPAAVATLDPPQRLPLMAAALSRFFVWVTVAVVAILLTGFGLIAAMGGFAAAGANVHAMTGAGIAMAVIFAGIRWGPYPRLVAAVAVRDWPAGAAALGVVRRWVAINLLLGTLTVAVATLGRGL
jgi:uncharacterized membrane protein